MKLKLTLSFVFLCVTGTLLSAQHQEILHPPSAQASARFANTHKLGVRQSGAPVFLDPATIVHQENWEVTLSQHGVRHESDIPKNQMDSIKREGRKLMQARDSMYDAPAFSDGSGSQGRSLIPYVNSSFKGNKFNFWSPPDNNLAVSDDGYLVSVINTTILVMDATGNILLEEDFEDFFGIMELNGGYFDPKVLYDPEEDRFILVVLNGNTPATSKIVIGFSKSINPVAGWWIYTFSGDPAGANLWLDYPSIAISTNDLYISGNQYTEDRIYSRVMIYQLSKGSGFRGENVSGVTYLDVRDAYGFSDFNVVPLSYGFDGSVGPGIYMVSTDGSGGTEAMFYYSDGDAQSNPTLYVYSTPIPNYYAPFDGLMLGTMDVIETNDCRTLTGFYADGTVHFAFNTRGDDFHTKVYYCRINTQDLTQASVKIGLTPYEYAYPAIAPFSTSDTDKSVLIAFLRTSSTIYPELRMIAVDHDMNFEESQLVKSGKSYVDFYAGPSERWGDYTGISRRHSATGPEVWISGCYGEAQDNGSSNVLCTWIAQVTSEQVNVPPTADFTSDITNVPAGSTVHFQDLSTNNPTKWQWFFPGGTPSLSGDQHPVIVYDEPGCHNVTLNAFNPAGTDVITKPCYIDVLTATTEADTMFNTFSLFPNPVNSGRLNIEFETGTSTKLDFLVVDEQGRVIRNLLHRMIKAGLNQFSFNTAPLLPGTYYLLVHDPASSILKSEKFIVL